jgi:tetratricopeptide (TPR) repeat protein
MFAVLLSSLNGRGDLAGARHALETFPADAILVTDVGHSMAEGLIGGRAYLPVMQKDFATALSLFDKDRSNLGELARLSARATIHVFAGDAAQARPEIEQARALAEKKLAKRPRDLDAVIQLSWINLALDRKSEALVAAHKAVDLMPPEKDALVGTYTLFNLAAIEAHADQAADAIKILRRLLFMPAGQVATIVRLKIDPVWDPIRKEAGFQQLLTGTELVGPDI